MADHVPGFEELDRYFEAAGLALGRGDRAAAAEALRAIIRDAEVREDAIEPLTVALTRLGDLELEDGREADAEGHFQRALALGERRHGPEHADLVVLLNALSRLYLRRGAHELAEPILQRLYTIKRAKGEDHPEVATVLASLANVRQALGRHDAAELLWRRVLEIRERTLAPNHVATASALERLAETCAARAKAREAVHLMQRALAMRELTLGTSHPTVRALRERIADLQLQATDEDTGGDTGFAPMTSSAAHAMPSYTSMPAWRSTNPSMSAPVVPPVMPPVAFTPAPVAPPVVPVVAAPAPAPIPAASAAPVAATTTAAPPPPAAPFAPAMPPVSRPMPQAMAPAANYTPDAKAAVATAAPRPVVMPYAPPVPVTTNADPVTAEQPARPQLSLVMPGAADGGLAIQQLLAEIDAEAEAAAAAPGVAAQAMALLRTHRRPALIAGVLVLLGAAFTVARARGSHEENGDPMGDLMRANAPTATGIPAMGPGGVPAYGPNGVASSAATGSANTSPGAASAAGFTGAEATRRSSEATPAERTTREPASRPAASEASREPSREGSAKPAAAAAMGAVPTLKMDDISKATAAATATAAQDPLANRLSSMSAKAALEEDAPVATRGTSTQPARLIGQVPVARYPQALRQSGVEGEVRVTFEVDTLGHPDMKTLAILKSDHELFTRSVRSVIPEMRFVPAEIDGKKARWLVRMPFVFAVAR